MAGQRVFDVGGIGLRYGWVHQCTIMIDFWAHISYWYLYNLKQHLLYWCIIVWLSVFTQNYSDEVFITLFPQDNELFLNLSHFWWVYRKGFLWRDNCLRILWTFQRKVSIKLARFTPRTRSEDFILSLHCHFTRYNPEFKWIQIPFTLRI